MVARASAGDTSEAMLASPSTLMCSFSPAALTASKSARVKWRIPSSSVCRTIDFLTSSAWAASPLRIAVRMKSVRLEALLHQQIDVAEVDVT